MVRTRLGGPEFFCVKRRRCNIGPCGFLPRDRERPFEARTERADRPSPGCFSPGSGAPERLASVRCAGGVEGCCSQAIRSKYCSFRALHIKLQLKPHEDQHTHYQPVDQPGFSAEFSKWFSKLRHCTFAPTVRRNDDKSENYPLQTVRLVYSLGPGLFPAHFISTSLCHSQVSRMAGKEPDSSEKQMTLL